MKINIKIPKKINIGEFKVSNPDYVLPKATKETLGGIKVGENLDIDEQGRLNATGGVSKEYVDRLIGDINSVLSTLTEVK
jgi:hypothetical protein